ncbi:hypothetical protein A2U01_0108435, partial [Trifolium medium]|nr:hypothetical protein [Trifolium medium]
MEIAVTAATEDETTTRVKVGALAEVAITTMV